MSHTMTDYKGYTARIYRDEECECYAGDVLYLENTIFDISGDTIEEAIKDFRFFIDNYLDDCKDKGIEPQQPIKPTITYKGYTTTIYRVEENEGYGADAPEILHPTEIIYGKTIEDTCTNYRMYIDKHLGKRKRSGKRELMGAMAATS